jgi:hypothetical protein
VSEQIDMYLELAACLNDKGFEVDEPTAELFEQWLIDFRMGFDWDNTEAMQAYEECTAVEKEN